PAPRRPDGRAAPAAAPDQRTARGRQARQRAALDGGELMGTTTAPADTPLDLRVGDLVEVRGQAEILATLDENGEYESLPFMPEMLKYCGQRLTVYKVAHKLCDTMTRLGIRRMENAVHLTGARCDGGGHGGCQAACLIYWKHAWLRKVDPAEAATT